MIPTIGLKLRRLVDANRQGLNLLTLIDEDLWCIKWLIVHPDAYATLSMMQYRSFETGRCIARHAFILRPELRGGMTHD